jgi:membrane protease YdiL (CAAX protease family)
MTKVLRYWPLVALVGLPACFFAAIAPGYINRFHVSTSEAIGIYACFLAMLALVVVPGVAAIRPSIERWPTGRFRLAILLIIWCLPYLIYAAGTVDFRWIAMVRLVCVTGLLLVVYAYFPVHDAATFSWQDLLVAALLIAALLSHQLNGIWNVPVNLDFMARLFLIVVASWSWTFLRPVPALGYEFSFSGRTVGVAAMSFAGFAVIAIPSGLAMHFISWHPRHRGLGFFVDYVEIFLFIALLEELFFRGFLQTLISSRLGSVRRSHIVVSFSFGLFHILHNPFPNWRYVLLASVAGWFYGWAFLKGGNMMAPVLTHAMVDTVWRNFF